MSYSSQPAARHASLARDASLKFSNDGSRSNSSPASIKSSPNSPHLPVGPSQARGRTSSSNGSTFRIGGTVAK